MSPDGSGTHADPVRAVRFGQSVLGSVFRTIREGGRMPPMSCMGRTGCRAFGEKTFGTRTRRRTDYLVGISPCDGSFRAGPPDRFQGVVDLYPCPGRRDGPDEAFRAVCRNRTVIPSGAGDAHRTVFPAEKRSLSRFEREAGTGAYRGVSVLLQQVRRPVDLVEREPADFAVADAAQ